MPKGKGASSRAGGGIYSNIFNKRRRKKMKIKGVALGILTLVLVVFASARVHAFEGSGSASVDFMSSYVWRGQKLVDNDDVMVQPALSVESAGFGFGFWTNYDTNYNENTETDLTLSYTRTYEGFSATVGYIHYDLINSLDTEEIFVSVAFDTMLSPSVTLFHDFDEGSGQYLLLSVGHSIDIGGDMALNLGASAGINFDDKILGTDKKGKEFSDFYNGELSASLSIPVTDSITIEPKVAYSFPLSDDADDAIEALNKGYNSGSDTEVFYGGVGVSASF